MRKTDVPVVTINVSITCNVTFCSVLSVSWGQHVNSSGKTTNTKCHCTGMVSSACREQRLVSFVVHLLNRDTAGCVGSTETLIQQLGISFSY